MPDGEPLNHQHQRRILIFVYFLIFSHKLDQDSTVHCPTCCLINVSTTSQTNALYVFIHVHLTHIATVLYGGLQGLSSILE